MVEEPQEVRAQARWLRITPRKARLVVEHIRGRSVPEARTVLAFTPRAAAREVEKVLASAVANAEANHGLIGDDLRLRPADEAGQVSRPRRQQRRQPESAPEESKAEEKSAEEKPKRQPRARKAAAKPKPKAESTSAKKPKSSSRKPESEGS